MDYELPGVTKELPNAVESLTTVEMEEPFTADAYVPEGEIPTLEYIGGKAEYYLYKKGIDINMLSCEEIEELEEELQSEFEETESVISDIPHVCRNTLMPPLDTSSDTIVYDVSDQEDLQSQKCSSSLNEIYCKVLLLLRLAIWWSCFLWLLNFCLY